MNRGFQVICIFLVRNRKNCSMRQLILNFSDQKKQMTLDRKIQQTSPPSFILREEYILKEHSYFLCIFVFTNFCVHSVVNWNKYFIKLRPVHKKWECTHVFYNYIENLNAPFDRNAPMFSIIIYRGVFSTGAMGALEPSILKNRLLAPAIFGHFSNVGKKLQVLNRNLINTQHRQY